jgi:dnd system-associated protein 4
MRNIRRSRKHDDFVSRLAERPVSEQLNQKIFPTYKALMCFAACLGFDRGAEEDVIDPVDFVDSRVIERDADCMDLIYLIGLAKARDSGILKDGPETEAQLANVFERFSEGGLGVLQQWMRETPSDAYGHAAIIAALHKHGYIAAPATQGSGEEPDF